jgi:hypothetical protein
MAVKAAGAVAIAAAGNCGWIAPAACTPLSGKSVAECPVGASAECSWGVTAAGRVEEELVEASALAATAGLFAGVCLLATAGCTVVANGLASATVVSGWSDAGVAAGAVAELFGGVAFGAAGAGAATAAGMATMVAKSAPVCGLALPVAGVGVGGVDALAAGWPLVFAVVARAAAAVVGSSAEAADATAVPAAALGSVWVCAGAAAIEEDVTDWLAAIAAAAIASGAVTGPDVAGAVGAAGTAVNVAGTGMATAIAFGAAISVASGEAALAGSVAAEASEDDELAVDLVPSTCEPGDFPRECDGESVVAPAPAAEVGAALAS